MVTLSKEVETKPKEVPTVHGFRVFVKGLAWKLKVVEKVAKPKLFRVEVYPALASSKLCEFIYPSLGPC